MSIADSHWRKVAGAPDPFEVRWFESIDSTNRYLLEAARAGAPSGLVAVADVQTAGRGRLGRRWDTEPGAALLASVLLRPGDLDPHLLTTAVAVALRDAVGTRTGVQPGLKWPNDLVVDDRKLAGVLAEADVRLSGVAVVVGAGTNVRAVPAEFADRAVACDDLGGAPVDREALLVDWLRALGPLLERPEVVMPRARAASATLGRRVRIELSPTDAVTGTARDLAESGELIVDTDDRGTVQYSAGDVVHLRPV
jgi:BirA family biotin operon repressor/biotin-[acetyl-CoA-carboxylase] ligase